MGNLQDLEAPRTLLPGVMKKVHQRAGKPWMARLVQSRIDPFRSLVLGISLVILGILLVVNPAQFLSQLPGASTLLNLIPLLLDAAKAELFQAKVFDFSVLELLAPVILLSYILLVATASAIQHLANARK